MNKSLSEKIAGKGGNPIPSFHTRQFPLTLPPWPFLPLKYRGSFLCYHDLWGAKTSHFSVPAGFSTEPLLDDLIQ